MDLSTEYLGLKLRTPLVPSASPLSESLDNIRRMEDAGASAIVLHSLFEEQLLEDRRELFHHMQYGVDSFPEALSYFPEPVDVRIGPEAYLDHLRRAKRAAGVPLIASLNGHTLGGWVAYAKELELAGADALELNIYAIPTDPDRSAAEVEQGYLDVVKAVKASTSLPVAVKLSPYFSSLANMAKRLDAAGADALVLFNRFYQPDIDLESLEVRPRILLSHPQAMRLPLRWVAILYGRVRAQLGATGGIHNAEDVVKMLMAGASVTMLCSVLLSRGIRHIKLIEKSLCDWLEANEYHSVRQLQGSMSQRACEDPAAFERAQYIRMLQSYQLKPQED